MISFKAENFIRNPLSFHIFKSEILKTQVEREHTHDFVEIVYVVDGAGVQRVGNREYTVKRGDLLFIGYGNVHSFYAEEKLAYYNVCFLPEVLCDRIASRSEAIDVLSLTALEELRGESAPLGLLRFDGDERFGMEFLLRETLEEYKSEFLERIAVLESYITVLLAKILRKAHSLKSRTEFCGVWQAISDFIDQNLGEKLTLSLLAQKCFYNPSYFSRAFKQKFGVSLVEYIARERVKKAKERLSVGDDSIEEIAAACGFGDKASLYRAFEKYYGCTPAEYRREKG